MTATIYEQLDSLVESGEPNAALDALIAHLRQNHLYHELFEALKMRLRTQLGLPAAQAEQEPQLDEAQELELERGLIDACRQVGELFLKQGKIREGWMYMRPVGDREVAAKALAAVEANDDNVDALLEVLLHEGVDIARGYRISLERMGTCSSITMFEQALAARPRSDQQIAAKILLEHVHRELFENLKRDISQRQKAEPSGETCEQLLEEHPDLLGDGSYHMDTSHLASTVRFARVLDDPESLRRGLDITAYGRRLHPQYQYPGEEPFLDLYPASGAFFRALLGQQVDAGIRYFTQKADSLDQEQFGLVAVEVLIDLLSRCGRHQEALAAFAKRIPADARTMGIAPTLLQLSRRLGKYEEMQSICKQREDLLGYTAALLQDSHQ
jgi:tetratricopeptide (TPR) repeat protein